MHNLFPLWIGTTTIKNNVLGRLFGKHFSECSPHSIYIPRHIDLDLRSLKGIFYEKVLLRCPLTTNFDLVKRRVNVV